MLQLQTNSYDHYTAFYLLLLERLKNKENANIQSITNNKHPSLESQRRRPSSIAEQAMRKLGLGPHQRYDFISIVIATDHNILKIVFEIYR